VTCILWWPSPGSAQPHRMLEATLPSSVVPVPESTHGSPSLPPGSLRPADVADRAPSQVVPQRPVSIVLPSGARMAIQRAATSGSGALLVPDDIGRAGWWTGGSRLGDPFGSIVVAAHVDSFTQGVGQFAELLQMEPGDMVRLESKGLRERFRVVWAHLVPKASLADDAAAFTPQGQGRLVLITCGGPYDSSLGGYQDNMVVVGVPVATARPLHP